MNSWSWAAAVIALMAIFALPPLYRSGLAHAAIANGDEAIYVEMAKEMIANERTSELSFDGDLIFPRPPAAIWTLAAAYLVGGTDPVEPPLRVVNALLCAVEVALTILLGSLLFSPLVGIAAGSLLATADLFVGYARVYESEPLLCCFVLAAFCAWAAARQRPWMWSLFGLALGGALLTKQLVGFLPLLAPIVSHRESKRGPLLGIAIAIAVALPWHVLMIARHGGAFIDSYFLRSLLGRAGGGLLHHTSPTFYVRELFSSEHWYFACAFLLSAVLAIIIGLRRRSTAELLVGSWAIGVLVIYSIARSRYDYYLLVAYPAFCLALAWLVDRAVPRGKPFVILALIALSAFVHLPRNLGPRPGEDETRALLQAARDVAPAAPLYTFDVFPYAARVYGGRPVHVFVDAARDIDAASALRATGMPAPAVLASPPQQAMKLAMRPSLLLLPRTRTDVLEGAYTVLGESPKYRLLLLR